MMASSNAGDKQWHDPYEDKMFFTLKPSRLKNSFEEGEQVAYSIVAHAILKQKPALKHTLVARLIAEGGYSKADLKRYLYEHARIPARVFEDLLHQEVTGMTIAEQVHQGNLSPEFVASDDPERLVPLLHRPEELFIVVSGMPQRNRSFVAAQIGHQGLATSREIKLPADWRKRLGRA